MINSIISNFYNFWLFNLDNWQCNCNNIWLFNFDNCNYQLFWQCHGIAICFQILTFQSWNLLLTFHIWLLLNFDFSTLTIAIINFFTFYFSIKFLIIQIITVFCYNFSIWLFNFRIVCGRPLFWLFNFDNCKCHFLTCQLSAIIKLFALFDFSILIIAFINFYKLILTFNCNWHIAW